MKIPALFFGSALAFTALIALALGDDIRVQEEKLIGFEGCSKVGITEKEINAAWDSANDLAYYSKGSISFDTQGARMYLGNEKFNKDGQGDLKCEQYPHQYSNLGFSCGLLSPPLRKLH